MTTRGTVALLVLLVLGVPAHALAQPRRPVSPPQGNRIAAQDGDLILLDDDAQVRVVRRREANIRLVFNPAERWLVVLVDYAKGGSDGRIDWAYNYREVNGDWPIAERWEGASTIEEYGMAGPGPSSRGIGIIGPHGLIQLFSGDGADADRFRDGAAVAVLTYRGAGGSRGVGETFDEAEVRQVADVRRSARAGAQIQTFPRGGAPGFEARLGAAPPTPPGTGGVAVRVGGNVQAPEKIADVAPVLPEAAARAGIRGSVIIEITIDTEGAVKDSRVLRSIPLLDAAALEAVRQWRYAPTRLNGKAVPVVMTVIVPFD